MAEALNLKVIAGQRGLDNAISGGYAADLLSCVMARAKTGNIWATLQAHPNVVAVATLLDLAGIIITEGAPVDEDAINKANSEGMPLMTTPHTTFWVVRELAKLGVQAQE